MSLSVQRASTVTSHISVTSTALGSGGHESNVQVAQQVPGLDAVVSGPSEVSDTFPQTVSGEGSGQERSGGQGPRAAAAVRRVELET